MEMCPTTHSYAHLAHSSVGQSSGLIIRRSWDHAPLGPLKRGCLKLSDSPFFRYFPSAERISVRRILPLMVLGSDSTNSITRGYL